MAAHLALAGKWEEKARTKVGSLPLSLDQLADVGRLAGLELRAARRARSLLVVGPGPRGLADPHSPAATRRGVSWRLSARRPSWVSRMGSKLGGFGLSAAGAWVAGVALDVGGGPDSATGWLTAFALLAAGGCSAQRSWSAANLAPSASRRFAIRTTRSTSSPTDKFRLGERR